MSWEEASKVIMQLPKELPEELNARVYRDRLGYVHILPEKGGDIDVSTWHFRSED
jgi:hypothetical protein